MHVSYRGSYLSYLLMYTFYFLSWALFSSLISVYLLDLGYQATQVSLLVSASFIASMLAQPIMGWLGDHFPIKGVTAIFFILAIIGAFAFGIADNIWTMSLAYSWVLLLINGTNPTMERLATSAPFAYGRIRIWGTIGFALGSQLAGLIYQCLSPQANFYIFMLTMSVTLLGIWGINPPTPLADESVDVKDTQTTATSKPFYRNKTYFCYFLLAMLFSGVTGAGHTYMPAILTNSGLSIAASSTVISLAVLCESPLIYFSYLFMDKLTSKQLLRVTVIIVFIQYTVYALEPASSFMVLATLLAKHTTGMLFIMTNMKIVASLVPSSSLLTALAFVQIGRNLGSILLQNIAGLLIDYMGYQMLCAVLAISSLFILLMLRFIQLPNGQDNHLFSR